MFGKPPCQQVFKWYYKSLNWHWDRLRQNWRKILFLNGLLKRQVGMRLVSVPCQFGTFQKRFHSSWAKVV
jgi:hypothetical protein